MNASPNTCDICSRELTKSYSDARSPVGSWANFCPSCAKLHGVSYGVGRGQRYIRQPDGQWLDERRVKERKASTGHGVATLERYIQLVDVEVGKKTGLSVHDLRDYDFSGAFEDGVSPATCASRVIRAR
jgi:hypothetical protein